MRKPFKLLAAVGIVLVLVNALGNNRKTIEKARADSARFESQWDSLFAAVRERKRLQATLTTERRTHELEANRLRDSVTTLEGHRAAAQLNVRQIRTVGALQDRLRTTFPELGTSAWGVTTVSIGDGDTLGLEYLLVPAWFAETFVIDHANAASWRAQKDQLLAIDSLRLVVTALQDSVTRLEAANAAAYQTGYQAAYAGYQDPAEAGPQSLGGHRHLHRRGGAVQQSAARCGAEFPGVRRAITRSTLSQQSCVTGVAARTVR